MADEIALQVVRQLDVPFHDWTDKQGRPIMVTIVITSDGRAWFPVAVLCRMLHVEARYQLDRLREHAVLSQMVAQLRVDTGPGGSQIAWCIERRAVGFWWGSIQLSKVRKEVQAHLLEHQWRLVDLADQALSGVVESDPVRAQLVTHDRQIADVTQFALSLERRIGRLEERE